MALAMIGPSRHVEANEPTLWQRIRFSSDRGIGRPIAANVLAEATARQHLLAADTGALSQVPVLLMDGEREGDELIAVLREARERLGPQARHVTVPDSHHYCGTYQLPILNAPVFVRPDVFERCAETLRSFLDEAVNGITTDNVPATLQATR